MQFTHVSGNNEALSEKLKFMFRQNCFANLVSDFKKKLPHRSLMLVVLINIFSLSDVLLSLILIFLLILNHK